MASKILVNISSGNGLCHLFGTKPLPEPIFTYQNSFNTKKKAFENVCKILTI